MTGNDVLVTGTPRSGTTLTCHLLNKLPDTVALHEPMKVKTLSDLTSPDEICPAIGRFLAEQRHSIANDGKAVSKNVSGAVPDNPFGSSRSHQGLRQSMASKGKIDIEKELSPDFWLVIKHNSAFAAVLGQLVECFQVYGIIRNPLATLASWNSVDFGGQEGHAGGAERLDPELRANLAGIADRLDRQIFLLGWFHERYRRFLPDRSVIRYESIVETGGRALAVVQPEARVLTEPLENRNANKLYDHQLMLRMGERLLQTAGGHWEFYSRESVERLMTEIASGVGDRRESPAE
jgi:hypothetical protein